MPVSEHKDWKNLLRRWLDGETNRQEESQLEQLARSDTFLSEALEGYRETPEANHLEDLSNLRDRLRGKYQKRERRILPMWKMAAAAAMFIGVIGSFWWLNQSVENQPSLAQDNSAFENKESVSEPAAAVQSETFSPKAKEEVGEIIEEDKAEKPKSQNKPTQKTQKPILESFSKKPASAPKSETPYKSNADIVEPISDSEEKTVSKKTEDISKQKSESLSKNRSSEDIFKDADEALADIFAEEEDYKSSEEKKETQITGDVKGGMEELPLTLENSLLKGTPAPFEPKEIRGQVTDRYGEPLIGANIIIPGTETGTVTDVDGNFSLNITGKEKELEISYTGFEPQIVSVDSQFLYQIELANSGIALSEIQVTSAKTKKRRSESYPIGSSTSLPVPKGGVEKFRQYVSKNLRYPQAAAEKDLKGEVTLMFLVNKNGSISNIRVQKSLSTECDAEAIRVLKNGPKWKTKSARDTTWTFSFSGKK